MRVEIWGGGPAGLYFALSLKRRWPEAALAFFEQVLRAQYDGDDAGTYVVDADAAGIFAGLGPLQFYTPGATTVSYPDRMLPNTGSTARLTYAGGQGGTAAVQYPGAYGLVHLGFPFESIDNRADRRAVLARALAFFGL